MVLTRHRWMPIAFIACVRCSPTCPRSGQSCASIQVRSLLPPRSRACAPSFVSLARSDILICNVVLPFAAAIALLEHDAALLAQAEWLYRTHPGLPSNAITRMMSAQLRLEHEPKGSCQQQGLHYIYQQTCRDKRCAVCIAGRDSL